MDRAELINRMTVLFGGRAAESLIYHDVSTGAGDDLAKATEIARSMVVRFGMDKKVGQVAYEHETAPLLEVPGGGDWRPRHYGESTAGDIDAAVRALTDESFQRAVVILTANRALLDQSANELLAKETFSAEDLEPISARLAVAGGETAGKHAVVTVS
jgi:cell division protease FtsH